MAWSCSNACANAAMVRSCSGCRWIIRNFPQLTDAEFGSAWAGLLPSTLDSLPYIGTVPGLSGIVVAAGHVFGNAAGPITGKLVSEIVRGSRPSLDLAPFRPDRHAGLSETNRLW